MFIAIIRTVIVLGALATSSAIAGQAPRSFPDQRLIEPVNDLPGPYQRVHPWGEIPYDARDYDSRMSFIGAVEGRDGSIYVLHRCNRNSCAGRPEPPLMKLDASGKLLAAWGAGLFEFPHSLSIDRDGNLWTTDEGNHVVRKFSADGKLLLTIGELDVAGNPPARLTSPTSVVVAPDGSIFVTEGHDNSPTAPVSRVTKWTADGRFVKTWGKTGTAPGDFSSPHTIAMDSRGRLFVGDRNNNRIQIFDQEGNFLDLWYQFGRPSGIVITRDDRMYVVDSESFDFHNPGWHKGIRIGSARDGKVEHFIRDLEPFTVSHSGAEGIGVDAKGNIYAAVVRRRMLEKYVPAGSAVPAIAPPPPPPGPALTHFMHVATAFEGTPGGRGLVVTASIAANEAMLSANYAAGAASDLEKMKVNVRRVRTALNPDAVGGQGAFGVTRAAAAIATHIELAVKDPEASEAMKKLGPGVASAARALAGRAQALTELSDRLLAATSAATAAPLAQQLRAMALELDTGKDVNGNGRIDLDASEPGLNQLEAQVYAILEAERLPRILR